MDLVLSNSLVTLDLTNQQTAKFNNITIPDTEKVPLRAGASMVFLPVGKKGILVLVGGVTVPDPTWLMGTDRKNTTVKEMVRDCLYNPNYSFSGEDKNVVWCGVLCGVVWFGADDGCLWFRWTH